MSNARISDESSPGIGSFSITPSGTKLASRIRSLYCPGAGNVTFTGADGVSDTWAVPDNFIIPVQMDYVTAYTGTGTLKGIK